MRELVHDDGFQIALAVGLTLSAGIAFLHRKPRFVHLGFEAGAASATAALVALFTTHRRAMLSLLGLALIVFGVIIGRWLRDRWKIVAVIPGAALIALALQAPVPDWAVVTCFGAILVTVPCAVALDRAAPRVLPVLLAATAIGMWATTPDTEHTRVLVGALVGVVVLGLDRRLRAGSAGTAAIVALMAWAATVDGYPRHGALVGALACFGVVVLLPLLEQSRIRLAPVPVVGVVVIQVAIVVIASRVAGLRNSAGAALGICVVTWVVAGALLRLAVRSTPR